MKKRNLFEELTEGFEALDAQRKGELTLRMVKLARVQGARGRLKAL